MTHRIPYIQPCVPKFPVYSSSLNPHNPHNPHNVSSAGDGNWTLRHINYSNQGHTASKQQSQELGLVKPRSGWSQRHYSLYYSNSAKKCVCRTKKKKKNCIVFLNLPFISCKINRLLKQIPVYYPSISWTTAEHKLNFVLLTMLIFYKQLVLLDYVPDLKYLFTLNSQHRIQIHKWWEKKGRRKWVRERTKQMTRIRSKTITNICLE